MGNRSHRNCVYCPLSEAENYHNVSLDGSVSALRLKGEVMGNTQ